jgi:hypothetical protein
MSSSVGQKPYLLLSSNCVMFLRNICTGKWTMTRNMASSDIYTVFYVSMLTFRMTLLMNR